MTPKEKAEELVYDKYFYHPKLYLSKGAAKICALIAVDEILEMVDKSMQGFLDSDIISYWKQVKKEIEKL
jgi:hypothetical protein